MTTQLPAARLAEMAVPENLAAIIDHYIAKARYRSAVAAGGGGRMRRRVPREYSVGRARTRPTWVGQACEALLNEQRWLVARACGPRRPMSVGASVFVQTRAFPAGAVRAHGHPGPGRCSTAKSAPRSNASGRRARRSPPAELAMHFERGREPLAALRYYAEAAEAALAQLEPGRVHEPHRARADAAKPGAAEHRAQRARSHSSDASWHIGHPDTWLHH